MNLMAFANFPNSELNNKLECLSEEWAIAAFKANNTQHLRMIYSN